MNQKKVYIIIINFNNWGDTLECLESVLNIGYTQFKIILIDNNSTDDSVYRIFQWAKGDLTVWCSSENPLRNLSYPPQPKPVHLHFIHSIQLKKILNQNNKNRSHKTTDLGDKIKIYFIQSDQNLGFAGANNLGIRFAHTLGDFNFVWLLNNDTVINKDALQNLVNKALTTPDIGICGSKLHHYNNPEQIQAIGGTLNTWLGVTHHITKMKNLHQLSDVTGASFLISKKCIKKIGLLPEEYFLYREETDYCLNAQKHGFKIAIASDSIVFHKLGKSSSYFLKDYYTSRNTLYLMQKYYPSRKLIVFSYLHFRMIISKFLFFQPKRLKPTLLGIKDFWLKKMGKYS